MCLKMYGDCCGRYLYWLTHHGGEVDLVVSNIHYVKHHVMDLPALPITQRPIRQDFFPPLPHLPPAPEPFIRRSRKIIEKEKEDEEKRVLEYMEASEKEEEVEFE